MDEGRKGWSLLAIQTKERPVTGRGKRSLLSDPGFELLYIYGGRKRKKSAEIIDGGEKNIE